MPKSQSSASSQPDPLRLHVKVWLERGDEVVLSEYRAQLLEAIAERGSVAAAAEALNLPVRTAWKKLREMEAAAGIPCWSPAPAATGGGSTLTPEAHAMVEAFRLVAGPASDAAKRGFADERRRFPL